MPPNEGQNQGELQVVLRFADEGANKGLMEFQRNLTATSKSIEDGFGKRQSDAVATFGAALATISQDLKFAAQSAGLAGRAFEVFGFGAAAALQTFSVAGEKVAGYGSILSKVILPQMGFAASLGAIALGAVELKSALALLGNENVSLADKFLAVNHAVGTLTLGFSGLIATLSTIYSVSALAARRMDEIGRSAVAAGALINNNLITAITRAETVFAKFVQTSPMVAKAVTAVGAAFITGSGPIGILTSRLLTVSPTLLAAAANTHTLARGVAQLGSTFGMAVRGVGQYLPVIGAVLSITSVVTQGIDKQSEALRKGENTWTSFAGVVYDATLKIGRTFAFMGGPATVAVYALAEALIRTSVDIAKFNMALVEMQVNAARWVATALVDPQQALRELGAVATRVADQTVGAIDRIVQSIPGPISEARNLMVSGGEAIVHGLEVAATGTTGLISGFAALTYEMRQAESVSKAFDLSMSKLGLSGKELVAGIQEQSKGLVSQIEIMEKANTVSSLIGDSALKAAGGMEAVMGRMVTSSMAAARSTGQSVEYMFNSIVMGVGRASPMILDNLGLALKLGDTYEQAAKKLGKSSKELTITEQKVALLNAVLDKGDEIAKKYGITSGGVNTQVQRFNVTMKDLAFQVGMAFGPSLRDLLIVFNDIASSLRGLVPWVEKALGFFYSIPAPIRNAVVAFSALNVAMNLISIGPAQQLLGILGLSGDALNGLIGPLRILGPLAIMAFTAWKTNALGVQDVVRDLMNTVDGRLTRLGLRLSDAGEAWGDFVGGLKMLQPLAREAIKNILMGDVEKGAQYLAQLSSNVMAAFRELFADLSSATGGAGDIAGSMIEQLFSGLASRVGEIFSAVVPVLLNEGARWITAIADGIVAGIGYLEGIITGLGGRIGTALADTIRNADAGGVVDAIINILSAIASAGGEIYAALVSLISQVWQEAINFVITSGPAILEAVATMVSTVEANLPGILASITETLLSWVTSAVDGIYNFFTQDLVSAVDDGVGNSVSRIQSSVGRIVTAVLSWISESARLIQEKMPEWSEKLGEVWDTHLKPAILNFMKEAGKFVGDNVGLLWSSLPGKWKLGAVAWALGFNGWKTKALLTIWTFRHELWAVFDEALQSLWEALPALIDIGSINLQMALENLLGLLLDGVTGLLSALFGQLLPQAEGEVDGFSLALVAKILGLTSVFNMTFGSLGQQIFAGIVEALAGVFSWLVGYIFGIGVWLSDQFTRLSARISAWLSKVTEPSSWDGFWENLKAALSQFAENAWATLKQEVTDLYNMAKGYFSDLGGRLGDAFARGVQAGAGRAVAGINAPSTASGQKGPYVPKVPGLIQGPWAPGVLPSKKSEGGGGGVPEEELPTGGGGGKGSKEKKPGGEGSEKKVDPVKEAFEKISTIANAVRDGIAAMKAIWTEFLGAPPSELMDQVFEALQDFAERGIELAKDLDLNVDELPAIKGALEVLQSTLQGFTGAIDAGNAVFRARMPSKERMTAIFATMKVFAEQGIELAETLLEMDLEEAVKTSTMAQEMGKVITSIAEAAIKSSEASSAISKGRWNVDFTGVKTFFMGAITLATEASAEFTRLSGAALLPRAIAESDMVAKSVGAWTESMSKSADAASKMERTRYPENLDEPKRLLGQVLELGLELTNSFTTRFGDLFMLVAEDMTIVAGAIDAFVAPIAGVAEAAQAIFATRAGVSLEQARGLLLEVLDIGLELTASLPSAELLRIAEDLSATADALTAWLSPLGKIQDAVRAAEIAATRPMPIGPLRELLGSLLTMALELADSHIGRIAGKIALALMDQKAVAEGLAQWIGLIANLDDVVASLEQTAFQGRWRSASDSLAAAKGILLAVGEMAWELTQASAGKLDPKTMMQSLADGTVVAQALTAWLEPLKGLAEAMASSRLAGAVGDPEATLAAVGRILRAVGSEAWGLVKDIIGAPGLADMQAASAVIAGTFSAWIGVFKLSAEFTLALRQMRVGEVGQRILYLRLLLAEVAGAAWELIKGAIASPGVNELQASSATIAATYGAWVDVFTSATDLSRKIRAFKAPATGWADPIKTFLASLGDVGEELTNAWVKGHYADPTGDAGVMGAVAGMLVGWAGAFGSVADTSRQIRHFVEPTSREWGAILSAVKTVWERFQPLAEQYIPDLLEWGLEAGPKSTAWAQAVGDITGALGSVLGLNIRHYTEPTAREWGAVESALRELWRRFSSIAGEVMPGILEDAQDFALFFTAWRESVGAIVDAVAAVAGVQLHEYVAPLNSEWDAVRRSLIAMWTRFKGLAETLMPDLLVYSQDLATLLGLWRDSVGAIAESVMAVAGVQLYMFVEPTQAEFDMVARALGKMWATFRALAIELMPKLMHDSEDLSAKLALWRESVGAIVGAVTEIAGVFLIRENVAQIADAAVAVLKNNITVLLEEFGEMAKDWAGKLRVPAVTASEIELWSQSVQAVLGAVGGALELALQLSGELVPKLPRAGMLTRLKTTIQYMMTLFGELTSTGSVMSGQAKGGGADPRRVGAEQEQAWMRWAAFAESIQAQIGAISDTIGLLVTLTDQGHKLASISPTVKGILKQAITSVTTLWDGLAKDFDQGSAEARAAVARSAVFAQNVGALVKPLADLAETILKLDGFLWETIQVINGAQPGSGAADQSYGLRKVEEVTPSGYNRYRRIVKVAREDIARILDMAKDFMEETRLLMAEMQAEFELRDPEGEFEKFMADLGGFMEKATAAADLAAKTAEAIDAVFNSALTVSIFASRGGLRQNDLITPSWLKVRERRADWAATQLKDSFKRQVRALVNAVKEALAEVTADGGIPTQGDVNPLNIVTTIVTAIANTITQIMEMPTVDEARIQALVNAVNLLQDIVLPDWMFKDVVGTTLSNLMMLLDKLNMVDPEKIVAAVAALKGLSFSDTVMEIAETKLSELTALVLALGGTGAGGAFGRGGANGPAFPNPGGVGGMDPTGIIGTILKEVLGDDSIGTILKEVLATLKDAFGRGGAHGPAFPNPAGGGVGMDPEGLIGQVLQGLPVPLNLVPVINPAGGGVGMDPEGLIGTILKEVLATLKDAFGRGGAHGPAFPNPGGGGGGVTPAGISGMPDVPGSDAFDYDRFGTMIGAAIPPARVDVEPPDVDLFAELVFPEAAYSLIARKIREQERGPSGHSQTGPVPIGTGRPDTRGRPGTGAPKGGWRFS